VENFFSTDGPLAEYLDGYESRPDQARMAQSVEALFAAPEQGTPGHPGYAKILMVEAETGIGKSLAYLVPAVLSGKRIVVSTATINLQDQLIDKEIPLIEKILGEKISALCVKGRQNYLCHYRWYQYRSSPQLTLVDDEQLSKIETWLEATETGDRSELDWLPDRSALWPKISAHSYQCLGGDCPEASLCFINRLRKKAGSAHILIVNHHLYFSDLALRQNGYGELLPRHEAVIFDEAHHLENVATSFFGTSISQYQLYDLIADIIQQADSDLSPDAADKIIGMAQGIKQRVERFAALFSAKRGRYNLSEYIRQNDNWHEEVQLLADGLRRMSEDLSLQVKQGDNWRVFEERARDLRQNLLFVGLPDLEETSGSHVYWYERRERAVSLSATPVHVADDLQRTLYSMVANCVLTSATLSSGNKFDYICQRLGLDEEIEILQLKSPFNYQDRSILYIPEDNFPEPSHSEYDNTLCERIESLLGISHGRALVLFTSFRGMDLVADYLEDRLHYPVLVQGTASRSKLLHLFREQTDSVLLAVASFWEGVDIPGKSLSAVIIDKLPFEVPSDPVVQARMQAISNNGNNPFFEFQVPRAVLTLRQGAGRLMRSLQDSGMIAVLDIRLFSKRYGKIFLRSMPPSPIIREIDTVQSFFTETVDNNEQERKVIT
jgi:ATP-dependent DNA helicase DinG